jgi:prepilin signal peptidase PulO-like enzyme (type II secretory pathway)
MGGDLTLAWDYLLPLIMLGVTVGVTFAVIFGFIKVGFKFAPYIVIAALLVWFFS